MGVQQFPVPESGIPKGTTAARPTSPTTGTVFYDGDTGSLIIWNGSAWIPCSAPAAQPTLSVVDVGTDRPYSAAQGTVTFTPGSGGGVATGYTVNSSTGGYSATTTGTTVTITVGTQGSWVFSGTAYNGFGVSPISPTQTITLTTNPEAASSVTATANTSNTNIAVAWTLGANGGKNLSAVSIVPFLNGTTEQTVTSVSTSATTGTVTGLTNGASYTFKIRKTNANGTTDSAASASIIVPVAIDYLIVAGGGGGGGASGSEGSGGGGAGGMLTGTSVLTPGVTTTVTVGSGGNGSQFTQSSGFQGNNSVFGSITTALGGGRGATAYTSGAAGGSGGAPGAYNNTQGAGTAGQGNNSGGGGGNGGGKGATGGSGGTGEASSITGSSVTYAAGGLGSQKPANAGAGSTGNGGQGGFDNTLGAAGGSGVVIIAYPDTIAAPTATTGSPSTPTRTGYRVYRWTGSGSITF